LNYSYLAKGHKTQKLTLIAKNTMMKKATFIFVMAALAVAFSPRAKAQTRESGTSYPYALGLKFGGYENGISGKYFIQSDVAIEGILGFRSHGLAITGLWEKHQTAFNVPELKFYYGGGGHLGSVGSGYYKRFNGDERYYNSSSILIGADGVLGLEYLIPETPIGVSLDLNPRLELGRGTFFDIAPGLGIKYTF
jgi:hypothetical protein